MTVHTRPSRRIGWGITGLSAATAVVAIAPTASADVQRLSIHPADQTIVAGTSYQLYASTGWGSHWITFYDNGQCVGGTRTTFSSETELDPYAYVSWTPSTAGTHVITADDGTAAKTLSVTVQPAPAGSTPAPPSAKPAGCSTLERLLGTGSAAAGN